MQILVAADLTITDERAAKVDFSIPFARDIDEIVVFSPGNGDDVQSLDDLSGRTLYVRESSSYFEHLLALNENLTRRALEPVEIIKANELLRTQDILEMVNTGLVAATVIDEYKASHWAQIFTDMRVRDDLVIHADGEMAWFFPQRQSATCYGCQQFRSRKSSRYADWQRADQSL